MKIRILTIILTLSSGMTVQKPLAAGRNADLKCGCYEAFKKSDAKRQPFSRDKVFSMYTARKYEKIIDFCHGSIQRPSDLQQSIAWIAEAGFALAEIDAKNGDPQSAPQIFLDSAADPIEHAYRHTFESGPNFWPPSTMKKYGNITVCSSQCFAQNASPSDENYTNYHLRLLSVYLRAKRFDDILQFIEKLPTKDTQGKSNAANYLDFAGQYIGFNAVPEGVRFLKTIKKTLNPQREDLQHWRQVYLYAVEHDSQMPSQIKEQIKHEIKKEF